MTGPGGTDRRGVDGRDAGGRDAEASRGRVVLRAGAATLEVDAADGGRWTSWTVDGLELLSGADTGLGAAFSHGCFAMAPYAGRVRDGRMTIGGREHRLPRVAAPHAIHGTVAGRAWSVVESTADRAVLRVDLGPDWPAAGTVEQHLHLHPDRLETVLTVHAAETMPATVGWHPWFARRLARGGEAEWVLSGGRLWETADDGVPTGDLVPRPPGPWDDAFRDLDRPPGIRWPGALELRMTSDARDAVLFDRLPDVLCLEPQTGPPDAARLGLAAELSPGESSTLACTWAWTTGGEPGPDDAEGCSAT